MSKDLIFSIVTPTCNSEKYLAETIESVISQTGNFRIEYIVVDNCSVDSTLEIIRKYQNDLQSGMRPVNCNEVKLYLISVNDTNMYQAINKGLSQANGDIFAWINSDDIYLSGSFNGIEKIFRKYQEVEWVKGITSYINHDSTIYKIGKCNLYAQELITQGLYGPVLNFIQQDSVFWRRSLWEVVDGLDESFSLAGDFDLWRRFAKQTNLYSFNAYVSCFRKTRHQKSENIDEYWKEVNEYDDIVRSAKTLRKRLTGYKNSGVTSFLSSLFDPQPVHTYQLFTVSNHGQIELHSGSYKQLQNIL